jgi:DNA-binding NtrC family response regulator
MPTPTVVIAQSDPVIARELASDLHAHFARVLAAQNTKELRTMLMRHEARLAVLDLETIGLQEVQDLCALFGDLVIVCTHHSPDEQMWISALDAGAVEFCHPLDLRTILQASRLAVQGRAAVHEEDDFAVAA